MNGMRYNLYNVTFNLKRVTEEMKKGDTSYIDELEYFVNTLIECSNDFNRLSDALVTHFQELPDLKIEHIEAN